MRMLASVLVVLLSATVASAQPGNVPPQPYPAPPPGPPPPYYPPQYAPQYPPLIQLTPDEHELLSEGEISTGVHLAGGLVSLFVPLGAAQAVQGRWDDTGWIFTLGEVGSIALLVTGAMASCSANECNAQDGELGMVVAGAIGLVGFRVWEIVDAFAGPASHNRRVRELRMRVGAPPPMYSRIAPYVDKPRHGSGDGGVVGLALRF